MDALRALGYEYRGGRLLQVGTDKGFEFKDQSHYDHLADAVLDYVGTLLVDEAKLQPISLPVEVETGPHCKIFCSPGFESMQKILLMIQGSGRVRVGVWGCALCINKDLDQGTMLPYLRTAAEQDYGVIVLNPNENEVAGQPIPGSETGANHLAYVWKHIIASRCSPTAMVDIVAHSNGGRVLLDFLAGNSGKDKLLAEEAFGRIRRVVFTDSYHSPDQVAALGPEVKAFLADPSRAVNYAPHPSPLGSPIDDWVTLGYHMTKAQKGCLCLSAAVEDHAATNQASQSSAFQFFAA
eukprot:TRINITY_DN23321_c0_g1_i1.p1 TRINITY_DN23321_c0_g1~~TRINITY_DN23321_c0_g1_i1.p1  ORF type:complete len:327 (+),score=50.50 TRINITY_DN23321_c0_g1_i1:98-982(+)